MNATSDQSPYSLTLIQRFIDNRLSKFKTSMVMSQAVQISRVSRFLITVFLFLYFLIYEKTTRDNTGKTEKQ